MSAKDELRELVDELTEHEAAQELRRLRVLRPTAPTGAEVERRERRLRQLAEEGAIIPEQAPGLSDDEIVGYDQRGLPA